MTDAKYMNGDAVLDHRLSEGTGTFTAYGGKGEMNGEGLSLAPKLNTTPKGSSGCDGVGDGFLFDPALLRNIPWSSESQSKFKHGISAQQPGQDLALRPLHINDHGKGILDILAMLTSVGSVSEEQFRLQFDMMRRCPNTYFVAVLEDKKSGQIIGCATLLLEYKFIHSAGIRGRIEDVVVSDEYRGRQLGKLLLETLTILGREFGCYKMSLECKDSLIKFYGQFGYVKDEGNNFLQQRFKV